jgi:hypothetical protein
MAPSDDRDHLGRRITTLMECALHRRSIRLSCRACPHVRVLDAVPLWYLFDRKGWSGFLREVPRRFYCARCWEDRQRRSPGPQLEITTEVALPPQFSYPDRRTWKRLVSRYRS